MLTGEENDEIAVKVMHCGAHDRAVKNDNMFRKLNMAVCQCLKLRDLKEELKMQKKNKLYFNGNSYLAHRNNYHYFTGSATYFLAEAAT